MEFDEVIMGRRSTRGYKPDPVPRALIEEILTLAMRAPSSMNTQPWHFYVITGEPLDRIRAGNTERMVAGVPQSREFRTGTAFAGTHRERQIGVAKQLFAAMGIDRDDAAGRQDWVMRGFRQFDAPVCVIIAYDKELASSDDTAFDCGAVATALVNAAWSRGLGTVINSQGIMQSPVVREHTGISDDHVIMKSIALGWPDESFPANAVVSERRGVEEAARFVGFDDRTDYTQSPVSVFHQPPRLPITSTVGDDGLRDCFRDPIPEIFEAAVLLDEAVAAHLSGAVDEADAKLRAADMPVIGEWLDSIWLGGPKNPHRAIRSVSDLPPVLPKPLRHLPRDAPPGMKKELVARDGHHCRLCGIPLVRPEVRKELMRLYPSAARWTGQRESQQHRGLQVMWLQYDHVVVHSRGGGTTMENIVVTCPACNFGRDRWMMAEVGLRDPRLHFRLPYWSGRDAWDGLERLLPQDLRFGRSASSSFTPPATPPPLRQALGR